ncbi:MAG: hypothetical protein JXO72_06915 [Vicinamibacteria bacterium]|nr:hypothetical protein [Vicinamibacteria bacterium]
MKHEDAHAPRTRNSRAILISIAGWIAASSWVTLCLRWFDDGSPWRPAVLSAVSPLPIFIVFAASCAFWLKNRWRSLRVLPTRSDRILTFLACGLALFFRLPMAWQGAAGYLTPDGALSGLLSIHIRDGVDHLVFVPRVPYSGSLKAHITAMMALVIDAPRAFALTSTFFYVLFVAAVCRLAGFLDQTKTRISLLAAGLLVAFAPPFITRYSLSNDGNYVEVLALGAWALVLACLFAQNQARRPHRALAAGVLLGLAFWCHILALYYIATFGLVLAISGPRVWKSWLNFGFGATLGYMPGIIWNASHDWRSFSYIFGNKAVGELSQGPGVIERLGLLLHEQFPVLMGYEPIEPSWLDVSRRVIAWLAIASVVFALVQAGARAWRGSRPDRVLIAFAMVNIGVCVCALPHVPGIPRYILFLITPGAVFIATAFNGRRARIWLTTLILFGAAGSWALWPAARHRDQERRRLVTGMERLGVHHCYTDFSLAPIIGFLSEERIICSAKLGPTTTEYFFEHRRAVEAASEAAFVPINLAAAAKIERRLGRLGVSYQRTNLTRPVLHRLSRKVDPQELFPHRRFPWR